MDKNEIKQLVQQYCEIEVLTPKKSPTVRLDETDTNDVKIDGEWTTINQHVNPSLGFRVLGLKEVQRACELGCGKIVPNQLIEVRKCDTPYKHWRTRCNACSSFVSPDGEGFIEGGHQIQSAYVKHYQAHKAEIDARVGITEEPEVSQVKHKSPKAQPKAKTKWIIEKDGRISLKVL